MTFKEFNERAQKREERLKKKWGKDRPRDIAQGVGGLPYAFLMIGIILAGIGIFG